MQAAAANAARFDELVAAFLRSPFELVVVTFACKLPK